MGTNPSRITAMQKPSSGSILRYIITCVGLAGAYFVAAKLGLELASVSPSATPIWPPTGIAIAALLLLGCRVWPAVLLGAFLANVTTAGSVATSIMIAIGNTLEGVVGAYLVNKYANGKNAFDRPGDVLKFAFVASVVSTAISATVGVTTLAVSGLAAWENYVSIWITWWRGDMGGALVIAPLVLLWSTGPWRRWHMKKVLEMCLLAAVLSMAATLVFGGWYQYTFLLLPVLIWVAIRFGQRESATAVLLIALFAIWKTLHGFGEFAMEAHSTNESLLFVQAFVGTIAVTILVLAAAVAATRRSNDNFESLVESIGDGIIATDESGKIIFVNKEFEDMLGWSAMESVGRYSREVIYMEDEEGRTLPDTERPLHVACTSGRKITAVRYLMRKNGKKFPARVTATPILWEGKIAGAVKVIHDVTEEKEIERAKNEFVSIASHELRTPLSIVSWYIESLLKKGNNNFSLQQTEYLGEIARANRRLIMIVNGILSVSRIELGTLAVEPQPISVSECVARVVTELEVKEKKKNLTIERHFDANLPPVPLDPKLAEIIFHNLVANAIQYTKEGGKVSVGITRKGSECVVHIADNGCGIPQDEQPKIFTKFFRAANAREMEPDGTGLGLYIVKSVVKMSGGRIWFESVENKGTTFFVAFPLTGMRARAGTRSLDRGAQAEV